MDTHLKVRLLYGVHIIRLTHLRGMYKLMKVPVKSYLLQGILKFLHLDQEELNYTPLLDIFIFLYPATR